ncbi:VanZ family protein [Streptomyces caniscabiei]|uniref:VanZ family protein n=1 Tax=Streptomyces caniscabiei TaxID=2746961 RepID=UPI0029A1723B|nr:VanZ family protein [Streptomyces caniscabiei]MDX2776119.1 VanZ family protein [Streptomyces caniscabiei]
MKTLFKAALLVIWMVGIFWFSSEGHDASTARSDAVVDLFPGGFGWPQDMATFLTRKAAHAFIYFVLGVLAFNLVKEYVPSKKYVILISAVFVLFYAVSDEFHQSFVPGRSAELRDVLIDTTAGAVGVLLYYLVIKLRSHDSRKGR